MKHSTASLARVLSGDMTEGFCLSCHNWVPVRHHKRNGRIQCMRLKCGTFSIAALRNFRPPIRDFALELGPALRERWRTQWASKVRGGTVITGKGTTPPMMVFHSPYDDREPSHHDMDFEDDALINDDSFNLAEERDDDAETADKWAMEHDNV